MQEGKYMLKALREHWVKLELTFSFFFVCNDSLLSSNVYTA